MKIKKLGVFDGDALIGKEDLSDLVEKAAHPNKTEILEYLRSGTELAMLAGLVRDILDSHRPPIGVPTVRTDGVWIWTDDLHYYVNKYNIRLPDEFIRKARESNWHAPVVSDIQKLEVYRILDGSS